MSDLASLRKNQKESRRIVERSVKRTYKRLRRAGYHSAAEVLRQGVAGEYLACNDLMPADDVMSPCEVFNVDSFVRRHAAELMRTPRDSQGA